MCPSVVAGFQSITRRSLTPTHLQNACGTHRDIATIMPHGFLRSARLRSNLFFTSSNEEHRAIP